MCESCFSSPVARRDFLAAAGTLGAGGLLADILAASAVSATRPAGLFHAGQDKQPARVMVAFLYPPADVVNEGRNEDNWNKHNWFT